MEAKIEITKKTFTGKDGKDHSYTSYDLKLGDKSFSLIPRAEDKKLLSYLLEEQGLLN